MPLSELTPLATQHLWIQATCCLVFEFSHASLTLLLHQSSAQVSPLRTSSRTPTLPWLSVSSVLLLVLSSLSGDFLVGLLGQLISPLFLQVHRPSFSCLPTFPAASAVPQRLGKGIAQSVSVMELTNELTLYPSSAHTFGVFLLL